MPQVVGLRVDFFLVDESIVRDEQSMARAASTLGGEILIADLRKTPGSIHHDPEKLALHLGHILAL